MRKLCKVQTFAQIKLPEGACAKKDDSIKPEPFLIGDLNRLFGEELDPELEQLNRYAHYDQNRMRDHDSDDVYDSEGDEGEYGGEGEDEEY